MDKSIDFNKIVVFCKTVEMGSFTKAATVLRQPKSRVSRAVSSLEAELGVQLIYRTTRQFRTTTEGLNFYKEVKGAVESIQDQVRSISESTEEIIGPIRITVPEDIANEFFGEICLEFMKVHPKVQIELIAANQVLDLAKESIDIALRIGELKDSSMRVRKVGYTSAIAFATPEYLSRQTSKPTLKNLSEFEALCFEPMSPNNTWHLLSGRKSKQIEVKPKITSTSSIIIRNMLLASQGVAILPEMLMREPLAKGEVVHLFKEWQTPAAPVHFLMPAQKEVSYKVKTFVEFCLDRLRPHFS